MHHQPSPFERVPAPAPPPRRRGFTPPVIVVLVALLVVSLLASVTLAVRVADQRADAARDRRIAEAARRELERLRTASPSPSAPVSPGPKPTFGSGPIDRIALAVARLRGLEFLSGITPEVLTPEQLRARVEEQIRTDSPREEIDASDTTLTALGLLAPDDDLYEILVGVQTEQVAGYYDNEAKKLVVAGNVSSPTPYDRVLLAHELTHALTDQHFGLSRLDELSDARKDDEATAFLSLVEGDATLMMALYRETVLTESERRRMDDEASGQSSSKLDAAPAVIRRSLLFPYERGVQFVGRLYERGRTAAIDRAYRDPPTSTEQIIHPERYVIRDEPQTVTLPDLAAALGDGWKQIDRGGAGELDVEIVVDQFLTDADARKAASGWDGGAYATLTSDKVALIALATVWDSEAEAREAADVLARWIRPRFASRGSAYRAGSAAGWTSPSGSAEVALQGARVVLVIGPDRASVGRARAAF